MTTIRSNKPVSVFPILFLMTLSVMLTAASGCVKTPQGNDPRPVYAVSVEPHAFLLEKIGGDRIRIEVLVPPGKEPENYEAAPNTIMALARTRVLFRTGMPFEETLLPKLQEVAKDLRIVDLRVGLVLRSLELHSHGDAPEETSTGHVHHAGCSHDGLDPHIWFAVTFLKKQAETILETLIQTDERPENADFYRRNFEKLIDEIETLRKELTEKLEPLKGRTVFVFHPSYGYFCDEFGLKQNAIEFEGKSPKPRQLAELIAQSRKEHRPPTIFVQPEFNQASAEAIAEATGGRIVVHSGLDRNILSSMRLFADEFVKAETGDGDR